ncbi:MAG: sigma-70 family RNA polymerase sigma factor, partial [Thermoanaerobaculia bacterium]
ALRAGRFEGRCGLRTYVSTFAHHKCIDRLRSRKRRTMVAIDQIELTSLAPSALDQLTRVEAAEVALRVQESMPDSCRELWSLLEEGLQYREMSRRLGVSEGALRARMLRCRRKALELRQRLAKKPRNKDVVGSTK